MPFDYKQTPCKKVSKSYEGADKFGVVYYNRVKESKIMSGTEETVFERCNAPCRPVVSKEKEYKLKWKTSNQQEEDKRGEMNEMNLEEARKTEDFRLARKIIIELQRNNILETAVKEEDLPMVKQFMRKKMSHPTKKIIEIMDDAMEHCYEEVMAHQDKYTVLSDSGMKSLFSDRQKSKQCMLDVLLTDHEFIPTAWGGRGVRTFANVSSGHPQASAESKETIPSMNGTQEKIDVLGQEKKCEDSLEETPPSVRDDDEQKAPDRRIVSPEKEENHDLQSGEATKLKICKPRSVESTEKSGDCHILTRPNEKSRFRSKISHEAHKRKHGTRRKRARGTRRKRFARSKLDKRRGKEKHRRPRSGAATPRVTRKSLSSEGSASSEQHRSEILLSERTPPSDKEKPAGEATRSPSVDRSKERNGKG